MHCQYVTCNWLAIYIEFYRHIRQALAWMDWWASLPYYILENVATLDEVNITLRSRDVI